MDSANIQAYCSVWPTLLAIFSLVTFFEEPIIIPFIWPETQLGTVFLFSSVSL